MGNDYEVYVSLLERGNELCKSREIPMTFTTIHEVQEIYERCRSLDNPLSDTPLIHASRFCYADLVWGFIQCAKQTNTNIHTGETGELEKFLGYRNSSDETALEVAIERDNIGVLKVLLEDVTLKELLTYRNHKGKTLILSNHEYDEIIFKAMKAAAKEKVDPSLTSISIAIDDDKHQESIIYKECMMHPNTHPLSLQYRQSTPLNKLDDGQLELAPNGDTIIHLISEFGYADDATPILEKHPSLIYIRNHNGETPLYVAAREGHINILELLISYVKTKNDMEALATRSTDKNNALHIAIENHHAQAVFWLVNEIPQLANCINDFNESPLYIAAQKGYHHILKLVLNECVERSLEGPNGKTALHAAVESDYCTRTSPTECIKSLLHENFDLLHIHDKHGWAPFHYAAYHNREEAIVTLLEADPLIIYQKTAGDLHTSAPHIAASRNHNRLMQYITDYCPGSSDIIDSKGRNILHVAVENKQTSVIKQLFGNEWLRNRLINQKDSNGNTPLHLIMASDIKISEIRIDDRVNMYVRNNDCQTPLDIASSEERRQILIKAMASGVWTDIKTCSSYHELSPLSESSHSKSEDERGRQMVSKVGDSLVVVIALIATATFAAAFTVPGGFDGDKGPKQGMPILLPKAAYKAFVVSNALAFSSSCCVLFAYMRLQIYIVHTYDFGKEDRKEQEEEIDQYIDNILSLQYWLTGFAMVAMAFAFVTGTYVILARSHAFAISVCAMCVCIIVPLSFFPTKYFRFFHMILNAVFDRD